MFRPTFGQTTNTSGFGSFSASNPNPFGQTSVFGKTQTTGFAQPTFGTSGSTGLFGNTLSSSSSLFGSTNTPTFGQAQTTQAFGFGGTSQPATNLFGAQQNAGTGLFSSGTSAFGANKPAFGSTFGTGTSSTLFGSQQPAQTATPLFGQTTSSTGTGLFGSSPGTFGSTAQASGSTIKFNPVTGTDTMVKNGVTQTINTRMFCITCMKEYENKSLEEIRYEDYLANRKGPQQNSVFGAPTQQSSIFGAPTATPNLFGAQQTENKPLFGGTSTSLGGFGANTGGVFGSTSTAGNSLFNKTAPFGTTTTTSGFGFGTPSTNTLFGNQNKPFGTTAPTGGGLFGQPTTQASTGGFGTTTGNFTGFGTQQNQSIGLFGQNKPATNFNLGTTTTSGFSFGTNTSTNTGLFGAKPATTSGFGAATNTGFGNFGANSFGTPTANTSSLFKPTTNTNFGFSTTPSSTGLGGNTLGMGNSLFGNTAQKPGGLFGNTTGGGFFGSSSFGSGTNSGGTGINLGGTSLGGGSLFGNTQLMQAQPTSSQTHPAILALSSVPFSDCALFKNLLPASGKADSLLKQNNAVTQKAMLACMDLKVSPKSSVKIKLKPLSAISTKKSLFEGLEESDVVSPSLATTSSNVKRLSLKPKFYNVNTSVSDSWVENNSNKENEIEKTPRRVSFTIPPESSRDEDDKGSFYIRRKPLFRPARHSTLVDLEQTAGVCSPNEKDSESNPNTPEGNKSNSSGNASTSQLDDTPNRDSSRQSTSLDETRGFLSDTSRFDDDWQPHPTGIILKRTNYYTIPSLEDLEHLVGEDGSCIVDNFCIGRVDYGNLYFDETMDVAGLNIDEIVHFRHKEVNVYPDDEKKPPVGTGLNRKCQVTLEQVWPLDKSTREPIKDPERLITMKYEDKLRRSTAKMGATFMEYRPLTGSWVFKVDHFSKYGLSDSDDEEADDRVPLQKPQIPPPVVAAKQLMTKPTQTPPPLGSKTPSSTVLSPILPTKQLCTSLDSHTFTVAKGKTFPAGDLGLDIDEDMDEEDGNEGDDLLESLDTTGGEHLSPSIHVAQRVGIDSHKVQLMKASLFEKENEEFGELGKLDTMAYMDYPMLDEMQDDHLDLKLPRGLHTLRSKFKQAPRTISSPFELRTLDFKPESIPSERFAQIPTVLRAPRPKTVNVVHCGTVLPYYKSTVAKLNARCLADIAVYTGRSFRPSWGPKSVITNLSTLWRSEYANGDANFCLDGRSSNDTSPNVLQTLMIYNKHMPEQFKDSIEEHLIIQLKYSTKGEEDGCPVMAPQSGVDALHAHCALACNDTESASDFSAYCKQVWELCVALWGNLPTLSVEDDPSSHKTIMMRKEAVTEWLKKCANSSVRSEVSKHLSDFKSEDRYVSAVLALLSGREIEEACCTLQKNGDHFAAILLASGPTCKPLLQDQLSEWQNVNADKYIDPERLKLFCITSGLPLYTSSQGLVNICENLDWKRTFALHFWYLLPPVSSIADIINKYELAFENSEPYACRPSPPYSEEVTTSKGKYIHDLCYHLLKLYCFKSHPLEQILNPATYSPDPLDYRLSWLVEKVLASLGYVHLSELSSSITCVSFASQLEANGLWHWAIFVYLHLVDNFRRKQAVVETIGRHVVLTEDRELTIEEDFVVDKLGVPAEWIYRAKATRALSEFRYHDATFYLIQAREWNEAHQIIIQHIAADEIINENYDYLRDLLKALAPNYTSISEWYHLGQLLWDYLEVIRIVDQALAERDIYELESRQSQISSLCTRILRWPCKTAKDRLCQAEISKRTAHVFHNVMQLGERMSMSEVMDVVSKLPLPEDYLSEELRHIKESFIET